MSSFFDLYMQGKATIDDLDNFLLEWHNSTSTKTVEDYLGLTKKQYYAWCDNPNKLKNELDRIKSTKQKSKQVENAESVCVAKRLIKLAKELLGENE